MKKNKKYANIIAMNYNFLLAKTPPEIAKTLSDRLKNKRKKMKLSQAKLAQMSGVSFASIRRFESIHEISLISFIKIAFALNLEKELLELFTQKEYNSIQEVING